MSSPTSASRNSSTKSSSTSSRSTRRPDRSLTREQGTATMPNFTVGKYLATRLEQIGLKHYFMVPGDYTLVLLDELLTNENLQQIGCCNELNAAYAAEGYA